MTLIKSFSIMAFALILTACSSAEVPKDTFYRLDIGIRPLGGQLVLDGVVEVERFRADGVISARAIAQSDAKGHVSTYHYHYWAEPPVDMLQDALIDYLRAGLVARHVVRPQLRMAEDYLITGEIKRLERDLSAEPAVLLSLELGLKRVADDKILVLKNYSRRLKQQGDDVGGAVAALQAALQEIYSEFLNDIAQ